MIYVLIALVCLMASSIDAMEKEKSERRKSELERRFTQNPQHNSETVELFREKLKEADSEVYLPLLENKEENYKGKEKKKKGQSDEDFSKVIAMSSVSGSTTSLADSVSCSESSSPRKTGKKEKFSFEEKLALNQIDFYTQMSDNWQKELIRLSTFIEKYLSLGNIVEAQEKYNDVLNEFNSYMDSNRINETCQEALTPNKRRLMRFVPRFPKTRKKDQKKEAEITTRVREAQKYIEDNKNRLRDWFSTTLLMNLQKVICEKGTQEYEKVAEEVKANGITQESISWMWNSLNMIDSYYTFVSIIRTDCSTKFNVDSEVGRDELPKKVTAMRSYLKTTLHYAENQDGTEGTSKGRKVTFGSPKQKTKSGEINYSFPKRRTKSFALVRTRRHKDVRSYLKEK